MYIVRIGQFTYLVAVILCISDFTSQVSDKLGSPIASGSSGDVYQCTIESSEGKTEVGLANQNPTSHTSDIHRPQ
jgi:hypothetical protein